MTTMKPIIWSIAGNDSAGGAGLAADQRAADACEVHLCPVVAAVTAQNSLSVTHIELMPPEVLNAQLQALAQDMPPRAIKTGLLGSANQVRLVAQWVDKLRASSSAPIALVVDPVLKSSTGASFADAQTVAAYREYLLPRATLITPNQREALALLGDIDLFSTALSNTASANSTKSDATQSDATPSNAEVATQTRLSIPELAKALRALGAQAVCITGGDSPERSDHLKSLSLDWLDSAHAQGWLANERVATPNNHGTGCTFATSAAAAMARGFVAADAVVLAKMATTHALRRAYAAGQGSGPVHAATGFTSDPSLLPLMSWGETAEFPVLQRQQMSTPTSVPSATPDALAPHVAPAPATLGLYAIVDSAARVDAVLAAGVRTVQLRVKTPAQPNAAWHTALQAAIAHSIKACKAAGAQLFINDHYALALQLGSTGLHLGQEDVLALTDAQRSDLCHSGVALGISSHSLWELARARSLAPAYIACGPVWPTLTKIMPWQAQGLDNLTWWCAMAGAPVVAIGGILSESQMTQTARCGASGVCAVRVLGDDPSQTVPPLQRALESGTAGERLNASNWPHPSL
jgi:hydroxymethylpyrimidine kinase / phosphomethylpyrimidine kinase / thiamine-phosphate diphosphorylase